ncbi:MAG: 16S rRNA (cytidine(1402)-2'-O)-methyltransferase [Rhodothermales bacterium]|nr:16S rRNA (cytidine(1402)-2'-O)-methyltransferase [Rhodothermales bacterium]MBO6780381.1 16S rRNA (cytidine(1402)-2'-O)-methyltransferase [Rhodothermales bacterium]
MAEGQLVLVPTPVGNLGDMTFRAVEALRAADLIACEDTRTTGVLTSHYGIDTPRTSFHIHNEHAKTPRLVEQMNDGLRLALVTDAGTPGISDPGFLLVRAAAAAGIRVECLPGPTAFVPALAASGLPCDRFVFEGFLPPKKGRKTRLEELAADPRTVVLYESPHRIVRTMRDLATHFGADRPACVAREISKQFEEYLRGTLSELHSLLSERTKVKGELVVVVGGSDG